MFVVCELLQLYSFVIIVRAITSFFPVSHGSPFASIVHALYTITEPVFQPIRRMLPPMGGFDFTPLVVLIGISIVQRILGC